MPPFWTHWTDLQSPLDGQKPFQEGRWSAVAQPASEGRERVSEWFVDLASLVLLQHLLLLLLLLLLLSLPFVFSYNFNPVPTPQKRKVGWFKDVRVLVG